MRGRNIDVWSHINKELISECFYILGKPQREEGYWHSSRVTRNMLYSTLLDYGKINVVVYSVLHDKKLRVYSYDARIQRYLDNYTDFTIDDLQSIKSFVEIMEET